MPKTSQVAFDLAQIARPSYFPYRAYRNVQGWKSLATLGCKLSLARGSLIRSSETVDYCYLVVSGIMGAYTQRADANPTQTAFFLEGSLFLEPSALSHLPSNLIYKALEPSTVMRIKHDELRSAMANNSQAFDFVLRSITLKLSASHEQLYETTHLDVRARIYFMLLGLAKDSGVADNEGWMRLGFKITQQQMSNMLGINRVTANTALQDLYDVHVVKKIGGFISYATLTALPRRHCSLRRKPALALR